MTDPVLLVIAGSGLDSDEASRIQAAVARALEHDDNEPSLYVVTADVELSGEDEFARVMHAAAAALRGEAHPPEPSP